MLIFSFILICNFFPFLGYHLNIETLNILYYNHSQKKKNLLYCCAAFFRYCLRITSDLPPFGCILQSNVVQILEIALVDEMDKEFDASRPCPINVLVESLPTISVQTRVNLNKHVKCNLQGISYIW